MNLEQRLIDIIGVPMDLGASHRGTDLGPGALRAAGLVKALEELGYPVNVEPDVVVPSSESRETYGDKAARFKEEILEVCQELANRVESSMHSGNMPLVLGGDHSIAMGTVAGLSQYYKAKKKTMGLLWVDAHGDMNTRASSPSGNIHGMPLAHILGIEGCEEELLSLASPSPWVDIKKTVLVGIRDIDKKEAAIVRDSGVHVYTMADIDNLGMPQVVKEVCDILTLETDGFHVSFDVDGLDPDVVAGVGTPVPGGINFREAHLLLEQLALTKKMLSMEVVELNPLLDNCNQGARNMIHLITSALGKSIL